jgi:FKBP-type peptidyl-prolyl cis-trans isomerase FklB
MPSCCNDKPDWPSRTQFQRSRLPLIAGENEVIQQRKAASLCPPVGINAKIIAMRKLFLTAATTLTVGILMLGTTIAQQTPAATPKPAPAKTSSTAKPHTTAAAAAKNPQVLTLKTQKDKISYAIGMNIGQSMKKDSLDVDPAILARGLKDALTGSKPLMSDEEAKFVMTEFRTEITKKKETEAQQAGDTNKQAGQQFLAANKTKEGVVTLPSGLQYKILKEGTGPKPAASDTVVTNYRGTLIDGTEFDSSYKRGEPATFPVGQVIKGWTEALQLMPVGSKWQLFIPADLAYGERSPGAEIGPNSTLIFDIELLSIKDKNP